MKPFDASGDFHPVAQGHELRRLAVRGAGASVLSSGTAFAVQTVATVVLARILAPADFGVMTMVTTFSLLLVSFGLNGFTEAVLQREQVNSWLASNLFWINVGMGSVLTLGFALCGPLMARFFGNEHVTKVAAAMSLTILIASTSVIHLALLKRAMCFTVLSANAVLSQVVSVTVSIVLGFAGWGYWALVAGAVAQQLSVAIGAWTLCPWLPRLPRRAPGTGEMIRFATHVYSHFIVNYATGNLDNILVGWRFNAESLGFYKKAFDLFVLPANQLLSPVGAVAITTLSRVYKDPAVYRRYLLYGLSILAFIGMAVGADLTLVGKDLIRIILGKQWGEAGRIFTFFGPGIGMMLIYGTHGWIHLSIGRAERWFRWGVIELAVTALLFVLGLHWGPVGIASAWTVSFWILIVPAFWYAGKPIDLKIAPILGTFWKYLVASLVAAVVTLEVVKFFPSIQAAPGFIGAVSRVVVTSLLFSTLYLGGIILLYGGLTPITQVVRLLPVVVPFTGRITKWFLPGTAVGDAPPGKSVAPMGVE